MKLNEKEEKKVAETGSKDAKDSKETKTETKDADTLTIEGRIYRLDFFRNFETNNVSSAYAKILERTCVTWNEVYRPKRAAT